MTDIEKYMVILDVEEVTAIRMMANMHSEDSDEFGKTAQVLFKLLERIKDNTPDSDEVT